ncbi:VWA domain-containing protein [Streptomyces auratus]|uniref:VWA domain-containing protein n=1 Tax=Streptomyces auratus AGR0001 TaxID=1160718 RepID=J2JV23_9ACTN|nr:VWA domain-containing protein [Streptomyces auratus]QTZ91291.1 VWA domain-containing protein [Streptomyces auratus AGR0001]
MSEYDARGKVNRALLICVDDYRHLRPLPAVKDNAQELERALLAPGADLFTRGEVVLCRPQEPWEVEQALDTVTQEARGLLLVYFSGHGRVGRDGGNLQLMVGASERRHKTVSWQDMVLSYLDNARADRIVIILECCYAGNAGEAFHNCRKPMSLLMAAQPNRRIFSGEEPTGGSVFTRAVRQTLEQGLPGRRFVTFEDLVRVLREQLAAERTPMGDIWEPRSAKQNTVDDVILSFATPEIRPPTPLRIRLRRRLKSSFQHWLRILLVSAIILVPATAGIVVLNLPNADAPCPPALELRLLTAPEAEPALRQAAFDYEMSGANLRPLSGEGDLPDGCRRAQITVYSAAKDQVDQGFAAADRWQGEARGTGKDRPADKGLDPLNRPGPQPDLWIPESTADYYEARRGMPATGSPATLHYGDPVAYTPLVVGIPANRRLDDVEPGGASWPELLTGTDHAHRDLKLLRPSPVLSGTGLLHTIGLYLAHGGPGAASPYGPDPDPALARTAEDRLSAPGSQYAGSTELLCSLRPDVAASGAVDRTRSAPLVSEKSLADYNLGRAIGSCPALGSALPVHDRYVAYYPENVPALDHPLIRVDWRGTTDATPRRAAVTRFATWLRDPEGGQRTLAAQGYRGVDHHTPGRDSPLSDSRANVGRDSRVSRYTAGPDQVARVLDGYDKAQKSSQVLILMDTSTSMADGGKLPVALSAAGRALEMAGARHTYGLWAFPDRAHPDDRAAVRELVPLGSDDPARGKAALDRVAGGELVDHGAAMEEALTRAVRTMKKSTATNKAIVLLLDEDDGTGGRAASVDRTLGTLVGEGPEVPVLALVLGKSGCDSFALRQLAGASHGQCVPGGPQAVDTLAGRIASIGTATKGER